MAQQQIIVPTVSAVAASDTTKFDVQVSATLSATLLAGAEEVDISYSGDGGASYQLVYQDDNPVTLTATKPQVRLLSPGLYRVAKDATAGACGVNLVK